jgi:hypothetical protein
MGDRNQQGDLFYATCLFFNTQFYRAILNQGKRRLIL